MVRVPSLALRVGTLINWPQDVHHKVLERYVSHLFQHNIHSTPAIRASTTGIDIQVTVLRNVTNDTGFHPLLTDPRVRLEVADLERAPGRFNRRMYNVRKEKAYFQDVFREGIPETLIKQAKLTQPESDPLHIMGIYTKYPVNVRVNVIRNPLLNAECLARFIAKSLSTSSKRPAAFLNSILPVK